MGKQPNSHSKRKLSQDTFLELIRADLLEYITTEMGGRVSGDNITKIICPGCEKPEAWTKVADPSTIHCNRKNNCGASTHAKTFAPHLWGNWSERFPPTNEDLHRTARIYLRSRELDTSKFAFEQGLWKEKSWERATVAFKCAWTDRRWHRLIDPPAGVGKTRWDSGHGDAYRGHAWTAGEIDSNQPLWIVEGILEALSIQQGADIQAAATFSSSHIPTSFYQTLDPTQPIIIALNSDTAGQDGTFKNIQKLEELGFTNVTVAQPPVGKDWNDLLVAGVFKEDRREQVIKDAFWRGKLLVAKTFRQYRKVYEERHGSPEKGGHYEGLLEYRGATWFCKVRPEGSGKNIKHTSEHSKVLDATIHSAFTQLQEEKEFHSTHTYFIEVHPETGDKDRIIQLSAEGLVTGNKLRVALKEKADVLLLESNLNVVNALVQRLKKQKAPVVRLVDRLGYDPQSGCYLFGKRAYDQKGQRIEANDKGFFPGLGLRCSSSELIEYNLDNPDSIDLKSIIQLLRKIYGNRAVFAMSYFTATLLKQEFLKKHSAFPYLSMAGPKGSGKTTLVNFLNNVFFQLWQGIASKDASTDKAVGRRFYHRHSLVIPFNEANGSLPKNLPENALLDAYHGGSLYDRAAKSQDAEVIGLPFDAGMAFVQNLEPFTMPAVKERVVTLRFLNAEEGGVTDETRTAMRELESLATSTRATIGHKLMEMLSALKRDIFAEMSGLQDELREHGVLSPRVAYTHSVVGATTNALLSRTGFSDEEIQAMEIMQELADLALLKDAKSGGSNDATTAFFEAFDQLSAQPIEVRSETFELVEGTHFLAHEDKLYVRPEEVKRMMKGAGYTIPANLKRALEAADVLVDQVKIRGVGGSGKEQHQNRWDVDKQYNCWVLKRPAD